MVSRSVQALAAMTICRTYTFDTEVVMSYPFFPFKVTGNGNEDYTVQSPYNSAGPKLNLAAVQALDLCDGSKSFDEIVKELSYRFQSSESDISRLTGKLVSDFADDGLVWVRDQKMRWFNAPPPQSIFWEITSECNLRCLHCVVSADKKLDGELTTEEGYRLIREWQEMGVQDITFSGGEPLLRKDFFDLVNAARQSNIGVQLATNGTTITAAVAQELKRLEVPTQVSIDGSNADVYGKFRGRREAFDQAVQGVEHLVSAGIEVTIGTVVTHHNIDDIPEMLKLVEKTGAGAFRLIPFIPYGRGKRNRKLELEPSRMKEITVYLSKRRSDVPFQIIPMEFECTFGPPVTTQVDTSRPSECGGAIQYCTVTPLGEVLPCHYFEGVVADNVKDHPFSWIWSRSRFLNYFRSMQISDISGPCQQCQWLGDCRGGCKAANFSQGTLFESNRHCWVATEGEQEKEQVSIC